MKFELDLSKVKNGKNATAHVVEQEPEKEETLGLTLSAAGAAIGMAVILGALIGYSRGFHAGKALGQTIENRMWCLSLLKVLGNS